MKWTFICAALLTMMLAGSSTAVYAQLRRSSPTQRLAPNLSRRPNPPKKTRLPASDPLPAYTTIYVSVYGSDLNDGTGWGRAKATIAGAYSALPTCIVPWPVNTLEGITSRRGTKCGKIYLAANGGGYPLLSTVTVGSMAVQIYGQGSQDTVINCEAQTCFEVDSPTENGAASNYDGGLQNLSIVGNGSTNQIGILNLDTSGTQFDDLHISGFTGRSASAITLENSSSGINERVGGTNIFLENNTCDINYAGSSRNPSFGHSFWYTLDITLFNGQTAICVGSNVSIYSSGFTGLINGSNQPGTTATALSIGSNSIVTGQFDMPVDTGGAETIAFCSGCNASNYHAFGYQFANDSTFKTQDLPIQIFTRTLGEPLSSLEFFSGGANKGERKTYIGSLFADGSRCLGTWDGSSEKFSVCPSTGALSVGSGSAMTSTGAGGTMASLGSNGISAGTLTLFSGSGSHTFSDAYSSPPVCTASDVNSAAAVRVTSTTTAVSITGRGSDLVAWICTPPAN